MVWKADLMHHICYWHFSLHLIATRLEAIASSTSLVGWRHTFDARPFEAATAFRSLKSGFVATVLRTLKRTMSASSSERASLLGAIGLYERGSWHY